MLFASGGSSSGPQLKLFTVGFRQDLVGGPGPDEGLAAVVPAVDEGPDLDHEVKDAVPQLLKLEHTGMCYAVSARRYVVYNQDEAGKIKVLKRSEHGLGAYLDPLTRSQERRDSHGNRIWIDEAWDWILDAHNNPEAPLPADLPEVGLHQPRKVPRLRAADAPLPAPIRQVRAGLALRGFTTSVPHVLLSIHAHRAHVIWQC